MQFQLRRRSTLSCWKLLPQLPFFFFLSLSLVDYYTTSFIVSAIIIFFFVISIRIFQSLAALPPPRVHRNSPPRGVCVSYIFFPALFFYNRHFTIITFLSHSNSVVSYTRVNADNENRVLVEKSSFITHIL